MTWARFAAGDLVGWEDGTGELLALVLHGGPGLSDYTESLADEVLAGGDGRLRVARYQQRGQEPSSTDGALTVAQFVEDAVTVIDHFGVDRALVVGHSWGGHLAMHIAVAYPERVAGLLLLDSLGAVGDGGFGTMADVIGGRLSPEAVAEVDALPDSGLSPDAQGTRRMQLIWPGYFSDPAVAPPAPADLRRCATVNTAVMGDALAQLSASYLEQRLGAVTAPAIHQIGRHSPIEPAANEKSAALMPNATVEVLDVGHFAWIEQPGVVTAATRRLLAQLA